MSRLRPFCFALLVGTLAAAAVVAQAPPAGAPAPAPAAPPAVEKVDPAQLPAVVAEYQGGKITREELLSEAQYRAQGLAGMGVQVAADTKVFLSEVLDMMLAARLLLADSTALGLTPSDTEIAAQFEELKKRFGNEEAYRAALQQQGTTEAELKSDLKENLAIQKLIETQLVPAIQVEDAAIQAFYDENAQRMIEPESFHASHILLRVAAEADAAARAAVRARAEALLAKAKGGTPFADLARESSEDPGSKERGGDLGWVRKGQTVPQFEQAALALEPGTLSGVVESPFGYHLIRLHEKRPERKVPLEEATPRIRQVLGEDLLRQAIDKRVGGLREKAGVKTFL